MNEFVQELRCAFTSGSMPRLAKGNPPMLRCRDCDGSDEVAGAAVVQQHIGGDDFVFLVAPDRAERLCMQVLMSFEKLAPTLCGDEDGERGHLEGHDQYGVRRRSAVEILSRSIIDVAEETLVDPRDIGTFASPRRREVKGIGSNAFARLQYQPTGD